MEKDDKSAGGLPGGSLIMVALLAAGALFISRAPLETSRPALADPHLERMEAAQDVDARLWQDPFSAVAKAREQAKKPAGDAGDDQTRHGAQRFTDELKRQADQAGDAGLVVLVVMLPGGPYAEQVESRQRTRYAVLASLKARRFVPSDNEHLGYFYHREGDVAASGPPETIVYEGLEAEPDGQPKCAVCRLMVLWVDSSAYFDRPLQKLASLATQRTPPSSTVRWRVLGPPTSDGLRAIVDEAAGPKFDAKPLGPVDLRIFSAAATAPDAALLGAAKVSADTTVSDYLRQRGVTLLRTIGTDDRLARALVSELELRGLRTRPPLGRKVRCPDVDSQTEADPRDLPSSIAIVSEGDTLYGRTLRRQFRYDPVTDQPGFCVTRWHYFRGLDGRLPGDVEASATEGRARRDVKAEAPDAVGRDGAYRERPEGQSQFDYLRRLANRIREEDAAQRRQYGRENGIRAIGVLGNDVYDKLLVLQALQVEMPHAIFFTTDLDARLFHPRELAWTRNLIVASNFGLRLSKPLQRDIAPFRDSYQASAYLAVQLLMADVEDAVSTSASGQPRWRQSDISRWFEQPRLFEVSRTGVFDFSQPADAMRGRASGATAGPSSRANGQPRKCRWHSLEACLDIHPQGSAMVPVSSFAGRLLAFGALSLALWAPALALSRSGRRRIRRFVAVKGRDAPARWLRLGGLLLALAVLAFGVPSLLALAWPHVAEAITRDGKPLSFTDGISPWPTYAIRLFTLAMCAYFIVLAWSSLASNVDRIARDFRLGATRRHLAAELEVEQRACTRWQRIVKMLSVRFYQERPPPPGAGKTTMTPPAERFWKHFIFQGRTSARLLRTGLCMALMIGLSLLITAAIGDAPIAPLRGELTQKMQTLSTLPAGLAVLFLIFFVVDATVLNVLFMRGLRLHRASWPDRTLNMFHARTGVPREYLDDWIDLEFIARRSRCVGGLIYYPFVALSLMLLARSTFFDDWYTPPSVAVLATLSYAIVLGCALALRRSAEGSRRVAIERLHDAILRAKSAGRNRLVGQLEVLCERVAQLSDGAFAPYSQQPLLRAVLLPFLTVGGSSLFDYIAMLKL